MAMRNQVPDKSLLQIVLRKLAQTATGSRSHVTANVNSGEVTLSGTIAYEHQRRAIVRSAISVSGVRRVIDQLRVEAKKKSWT